MKNRIYYTLEDLYKLYGYTSDKLYALNTSTPYKSTTTLFYDFIYASICEEDYQPAGSDIVRTNEANILWCTYIYPRFKNIAVCYSDEELTSDEKKELFDEWIIHYVNVLKRHYDEYKKLIDIFEDIKADLMDDIKVLSVSKYNDTPQAVNNSFEDDNYVSNITTSESSNPLATKMARLKEVELNIVNYYQKWANEFGGLFIYE